MPQAKHVKFSRALVKQFGRVETRKILEFMKEEGDDSIKKLSQLSYEYLFGERITQKELEDAVKGRFNDE